MSDNVFVIDENTSEGGKNISIFEEKDFIQLCEITKYELDPEEKYINCEVKNERGKISTKRFYLPKDKSEYPDEKKYTSAVRTFVSNMANIARRFKGKDFKVEGKNALDMAQKVISIVHPILATKKVHVLFELNKGDRGTFTNVSSFSPFADDAKDLTISAAQKVLLHEFRSGKSSGVEADVDTPPAGGKIPF